MQKILLLSILLLSLKVSAQEKKMSRAEYIEKYSEWAVKEMKSNGIPASITLAQGMLESNNGNSRLAIKANNHFGIKCHSSWTGKKIYKNDDEKHECFRKYKSAHESYKDHSDFLKNGKRYAFLFDLKPTDYKGWAKGLKKAGYATNSKYSILLIKIIEDNELHKFDKGKVIKPDNDNTNLVADSKKPKTKRDKRHKKRKTHHLGDVDNYTVNLFQREVKLNNRIKYIKVKKGDTFLKIAQEFEMMAGQLYRYNELDKNTSLKEGQILYIQPKRSKADFGKEYHVVTKGETIYTISQKYGIKLNKLYFKNNIPIDSKVKVGDKLWLRKRIPPEN